MNSHPLILTAAEVRAVLSGTKTQHRVRVKFTRPPPWQIMDESDDGQPWPFYQDEFGDNHPMRCPFGTPGDNDCHDGRKMNAVSFVRLRGLPIDYPEA